MNPSALFIRKPVATTLLMIAIMMAGMLGYYFLPVSALPQVDYPTITVETFYPGAGPEVMATSITAPLETQFGQMSGVDQITSRSSGGASIITMRFSLSMTMDVAEQEVQAAINNANSLLPSDLPAPPVYAKVNPADTPVITLGITSATIPLPEVEDYVDTRLSQKISQISGVGLVTLSGGNRKAIRVRVNVPKLTSYGVDMDTLRTTIGNVNVNSPTGTFNGQERAVTLRVDGQISSVDMLLNQVIAYQNSGPVRVRDIASVVIGAENSQLAAWANLTPALIMNVQRQPGANVIDVVDNIKAALPQLRLSLPPGIDITPLTDRTTTIRASVADVEFELFLALLLVVGVIFIFLRNIPATIIPSLSVPLSIVGTFAVMYLMGFSLDNLSLMALTIATGFVVDDAIVMIENISRYIELGEDRMTAAIRGAGEIGFTIISLTISLVAVLIPLLFMGDVVGRLFHEFAMTLAVTIILSAIVSLTLVPMMCAYILSERIHNPHLPQTAFQRWSQSVENATERLIAFYGRGLDIVLEHRGLTLCVATATVVLTCVLAIIIPKGFFPDQDTGVIQGVSVASQSISFESMKQHQQELARIILKDPDVASLSSFVGIDGQNSTLNQGRFLINLKDREQRSGSAAEIASRLSQTTAKVVGIKLYMQPIQDLTLDTTVTATQYQFLLENPDPKLFDTWIPLLLQRLRKEPALSEVTSDLQAQGLVVKVVLDRTTAARYSITPQTIDNILYDSFGQRQISTIYTQANQYRVIMEADPLLQTSQKSLNQLYLPGISGNSGESVSGPTRSPTSGLVPLPAVTQIQHKTAPLLITHFGQFPATTISFNLSDGYSLGDATAAIRRVEKDIKLPPSFQTSFQGTAAAFEGSQGNELFLIGAALVAVYIVLGVLYESFIHPVTILSTLPSAAIGALLALMISGAGLDIMGIIGIVLLIGIVKKNAIMMIDFALEASRVYGMDSLQAIRQAALLRFRPILMTTLAAMLGALPMVLVHGNGAELRYPLGLSIIAGLAMSQILTLFTTPVIYLALDGLSNRWKTWRNGKSMPEPEAP
ncbi:efflux RND transporter permease subunit [Acetobacter thailandicus]|uniref:efflux RND transporter permease subunit n=1 Tax=Acetobacter thailandicus TaxID=1502842 RepID=UPI001BABB2BD|nr:efflux RND transporter permease subunit [Acetobacter thailandicus]